METSRYLFRSIFLIMLILFFASTGIYPACLGPTSAPPPPLGAQSLTHSGGNNIIQGKILSFVKNKDFDLLNIEETPSFNSATNLNGTGITQIGGIKEDKNGNMYVTGGFTDSLTFNTQPSPTVLVSSGGYNVFLAKYDASGNCLWVRTARGDKSTPDSLSINGSLCIAVDTAGNSYIGGGFVRSLSFIDSQNKVAARLTSADTTIYNFEFFVAKYNTNGDLLWAKGGQSGSHGDAADLNHGVNGVTSIILDAQDLPYIGGRFSGGNFLGENVGFEEDGDFFLAALTPDSGKVAWGWVLGTPGEDGVISLSLDVYGYINALGFMGQGTIAFPTSPETDLTDNSDSADTFVAKFDVNGNCLWADLIGGNELIFPQDISTDTLGNVYISGAFKGTTTFGSGIKLTATGSHNDGFLAKYDFNGNCRWARRFGGDIFAEGNRIAADGIGDSFVFSTFQKDVVFGSETPQSQDSLTTSFTSMVVAKYDSSGNFQWVKTLNGTGWGGISEITSDICPVRNNPLQISYSNKKGGDLLLSGDFNKQISLDNYTLTAPGDARNSFIARLGLSGNATAVENRSVVPLNFSLDQNYPNPFNPSTVISYQLAAGGNVTLKIYDILGREVKTLVNDYEQAGRHKVSFEASNLASGVYLYRLDAGKYSSVKKLVLLK